MDLRSLRPSRIFLAPLAVKFFLVAWKKLLIAKVAKESRSSRRQGHAQVNDIWISNPPLARACPLIIGGP
jgi:hypothetical protein